MQSVSGENICRVTLGSLTIEEPCYGTSATAIERTDEAQPKYIRITDFDDFGIEPGHKYMTAESYSEKHFLKENDILFARTGGTVGKTFFCDEHIGNAIFAGYCIRFRFDSNKILPKFVYWYTKTESYANWVNGIQRPSGQPNINKEEYKSYEIIKPSKIIQKELVRMMDDAAYVRLHKLQQANTVVEHAKKAVFAALGIAFEKYVPSIFSCSHLKDIREMGIYCNPHSAYLNNILAMFRNSSFYVGHLEDYVDINPTINRSDLTDRSAVSFVSMQAVAERVNHVEYEICEYEKVKTGFTPFKKGDLLWAKITPCMQNGKSFLATEMPTEFGFGSTEFHVIRSKSKKVYMPYLWILFSEEHILEAAQGMFSGSAGQQRVPDIFLRKFPLILPSPEMQKELADKVLLALAQANTLRQEAEQGWQVAKVKFEKKLLE